MMSHRPSPFRTTVRAIAMFAGLVAWSGPALSDETTPVTPADEQAFLRVRPLPAGLDAVEPIPGAVNVRFLDCAASWPEGYKVHRAEGSKMEGYARKRDIYLYLQASQAYVSRDCGCAGKVAPWEPVEAIYAGLQEEFGEVTQVQTADYATAAARLIDAVEILCQGRF